MLISAITFVLYIVILIAIGVITYLRAKSYSDSLLSKIAQISKCPPVIARLC